MVNGLVNENQNLKMKRQWNWDFRMSKYAPNTNQRKRQYSILRNWKRI